MVFGLDNLPLLVPERVGELEIVLLRQSGVEEDSWELDYAAVGRVDGELVFEARDEAGTEYFQHGAGGRGTTDSSSAPKHSRLGWARVSPRLSFSSPIEEPDSGPTPEGRDQSPSAVAAHWAKRLQSQRAAWSQRGAVVEAILAAPTRDDALGRLS